MQITLLPWSDRVGITIDHRGKSRHLSILAPEMFGKEDSSHEYSEVECANWMRSLGFEMLGTAGFREVEKFTMTNDLLDGGSTFFFTIDGIEYNIIGRGAEISIMP